MEHVSTRGTRKIIARCTIHVPGLFEDQAGRFDWKQKYVGEASNVGYFADSKISMLILATKSHVVAGLDADNGVIRWRHVFKSDDIGQVWDMHVSDNSRHCTSVSGNEMLFVRVWDSVSGALVVEHLVRADRAPDLVSVHDNNLVTVNYDGNEMEIVSYNYDNKKIGDGVKIVSRTPFHTGNLGGAVCQMTDDQVLMCANDKGVHSLDVKTKSSSWQSNSVSGVKSDSLRVSGHLAELELASGKVAKLDTKTNIVL